jgi:hypothetical protein
VTTSIDELLRDDERAILTEAASSLARLEHYRRDGEAAARRRLEALYRHLAGAVSARDLDDLLGHVARIARERFEAGFELREVEAAFATLEDAISRRAVARLPACELAWGIGLVATALAHARAELGRTFAALAPAARPGTLDLTAVFQRTERGRPAEELVYPV